MMLSAVGAGWTSESGDGDEPNCWLGSNTNGIDEDIEEDVVD